MAPLGIGLLSPILETLITPFNTSPADIGLMISLFTAPSVLIIPISGVLSDRFGRKPILVGSLILFGLSGTAVAFTTDFRVALGFRLIQGIAFGGLTPIIITSLGDIYESTAEATAQGIRFTGSGLSNTVFPLISGVLVVVAWQFPFLIYLLALPIAAIVFVFLDEPITHRIDESVRDTQATQKQQLFRVAALLRQRRVVAMVIATGLPMATWIGFVTYNSIIVVRLLDGTPTQAGVLVAVASLIYGVSASQAGRITSMFESRLYPLIGANISMAVGFVVFLLAPSLIIAAGGIVVSGIGFGLTLALYRSVITGMAKGTLRGSLVSIAESFGRGIATVTPVVMGGIIGLATPHVGLGPAVQIAGTLTVCISGGGGVFCLLAANAAHPIENVS